MSIDTKHPLYTERFPQWEKLRDVIAGEEQVKSKGRKYLPALSGQSGELAFRDDRGHAVTPYADYLMRAKLLNATGRTLEGFVGAILRKDPRISNVNDRVRDQLDRAGKSQERFNEVVQETIEEVIGVGRFGILVDWPAEEDGSFDAEPFFALYKAESIRDWDDVVFQGRRRVTGVKLEEERLLRDEKGERQTRRRLRVLKLGFPEPATYEERQIVENEGLEGFWALFGLSAQEVSRFNFRVYYQEIWDQVEEAGGRAREDEFIRTSVVVPRKLGGQLWGEIPIVIFNPMSLKAKPEKPPLLDIANVNFSHYRGTADLKHGLHFTALPQPWLAGFDQKGELVIGSGVAWVSEDPRARAGYLEFSGAGLTAIREDLEDEKKEMAMLGARLLEEQPRHVEAEGTVKARQAGEKSALARIATSISTGLTKVVRLFGEWQLQDLSAAEVELNTDYGVQQLGSAELTALIAALQSGTMSYQTFFYNLQRGEIYPDGWTEKDEVAAIIEGIPGLEFKPEPPDTAPQPDDEEPVEEEEEDAEPAGNRSSDR